MHHTKPIDNMDILDMLQHPKVIKTKNDQCHTCQPPKCAACLLGKMERISPSTTTTHGSDNRNSLKGNDLQPGQCVSMDQYVVTTKGRTLSTARDDTKKYNGGTVFTDHSSGKIFSHHQISLRTGETLIGKRMLECNADQHRFKINGFLTDNGVFNSQEFTDNINRKNQTIKFSGVGARHQNGVAEHTIKTISYLA